MSRNRTGSKNGNFGNHWKMSEDGREQCRQRLSGSGNPMYGKKHSDETKKLISSKNIGRTTGTTFMTNGEIDKMVKPEDIDYYLSIGYWKGRTKTRKNKPKTEL